MKIVINKCYGGFGLSEEAQKFLGKDWNGERADLALIQCVEKLGSKVNTDYSKLTIIEIPDGIEYEIEEYDGIEWVAEKHRTWQ